jgi:hypothetical protein
VEKLQQLQREDLLEEIMQRQEADSVDSALIGGLPTGGKDVS